MNALIHKKYGAVVAYTPEPFQTAEHFVSTNATSVNGEPIVKGSIIICPYCHDNVRIFHMRQKDLSK